MKDKVNVQVTTPEFRVSFPVVWEAKAMNDQPGAKKKFSLVGLFDKTDPKVIPGLKEMEAAVAQVLNAKFGDQAKWPRLPNGQLAFRLPFRNGADKTYDGYGPNIIFVSFSTEQKPGIVFPWPGPDGKTPAPLTDPKDFYAGCFARATVNPYYYDKAGNRGVAFGLRNIQKLRDGEAFSGKNAAEKDFDSIETPPAALDAIGGQAAGAQSAVPAQQSAAPTGGLGLGL
jgi:hypothetical protein